MTKANDFNKLLDAFLQFANETDAEEIHDLFLSILSGTRNMGFVLDMEKTFDKENARKQKDMYFVFVNYRDPDNDYAVKYHADLLERLSEIADTGNLTTSHCGELICMADGNGMRTIVSFKDTDGKHDSLSAIFIMLILLNDGKGVKKCPGCNEFFILKRKIDQRTCSDKCRQRVYQASLSTEKKRKAKMRRSELYRQKQRGGE